MSKSARFRAACTNARTMRADGRNEGLLDWMVAVFDKPDTNVAVGNSKRQIIDQGAFRGWIETLKGRTVPFYRDHGMAPVLGVVDSSLKLGYGDNVRETEEGLAFTAHYNLDTREGFEAFSNANFDPLGAQASFRWDEDDVYDGKDGFEHVRSFNEVLEFSQVGFGAQEDTHPILAGAGGRMRTAIGGHTTETSDASWDADTQWGNLKSGGDGDSANLRKATAWVNPDGDANTKDAYSFIHHFVSSDGTVGSASTVGCSAAIGVLNGARVQAGDNTPWVKDRAGIYSHVAKHLTDAGKEPAELQARSEDIIRWAEESEDFREVLLSDLGDLLLRHQWHGEKVPRKPTVSLLKEWVKDSDFRKRLLDVLGIEEEGSRSEEPEPPAGPILVDVDPEIVRSLNSLISRGTEMGQAQDLLPLPSVRAVNLDDASMTVRRAWYDLQRPQAGAVAEPMESGYVEEVWANDAAGTSGYVIVCGADGYYEQTWTRTEAGVEFSSEETPVRKEWTPARAGLGRQVVDWLRMQTVAADPSALGDFYQVLFESRAG